MNMGAVCVLLLFIYSLLVSAGQIEGGALTVFKLTVNAAGTKV